ncbi:MAG: thioesterase [Calditrichaeota bacterium]|nr:MAG: thioesterase [Calditrichota bacterium]MBL1205668.1 thioesterase [Calditrichota bacterium]NOG45496.1 thioesterase family protein [Calditrichota bacterium]
MNLYFRFLKLVLSLFFIKKKHPLDESVMQFRAWPLDCDYNMHVTNARYLSFMDLGRSHLIGQAGLIKKIHQNKFLPIATSVEISYFKEIKPFQRFHLHSRMIFWDEKYWYIRQEFKSGEKLHAVAMVRGLFVKGREKIPFQKIVDLVDETISTPEEPKTVTAWKALLDAKKVSKYQSKSLTD